MISVVWVISGIQLIQSVGIVLYWLLWLRNPPADPWLPNGYREHERCFVWPDSLAAIFLAVSAVSGGAGWPIARPTALIAAGMLFFLGAIDATYFAQNGMFARNRGGGVNLATVVCVLIVALTSSIYYF